MPARALLRPPPLLPEPPAHPTARLSCIEVLVLTILGLDPSACSCSTEPTKAS